MASATLKESHKQADGHEVVSRLKGGTMLGGTMLLGEIMRGLIVLLTFAGGAIMADASIVALNAWDIVPIVDVAIRSVVLIATVAACAFLFETYNPAKL